MQQDYHLHFIDEVHLHGENSATRKESEFSQTVKENDTAGTYHGTAGPLFLAGPYVKAGFVGTMPKLLDPDPKHGNLRVSTDFRAVYATVLEDWLGLSAKSAMGADFEKLSLFRT